MKLADYHILTREREFISLVKKIKSKDFFDRNFNKLVLQSFKKIKNTKNEFFVFYFCSYITNYQLPDQILFLLFKHFCNNNTFLKVKLIRNINKIEKYYNSFDLNDFCCLTGLIANQRTKDEILISILRFHNYNIFIFLRIINERRADKFYRFFIKNLFSDIMSDFSIDEYKILFIVKYFKNKGSCYTLLMAMNLLRSKKDFFVKLGKNLIEELKH
jgi:hypothetical protein